MQSTWTRANALAAADDGVAPTAVLADDSWNIVDRILSTPTVPWPVDPPA